jgi:hypothetical protein
MPSLKTYAPSRTELPPTFRRRVWAAPTVSSHAAVVLTPALLYLADGAGPVSDETIAAAERGEDLKQLFGSMVVPVNLPSVVRVLLDLPANTVHVEFTNEHRAGTTRVSATFAEAETADEVFTILWRRLGSEWSARPVRPAWWDRVRIPATTLAGVLTATLLLGLAATVTQDADPASAGWLRLLDWRFVCGSGGALAALAQVWLYRRATQPAAAIELGRE